MSGHRHEERPDLDWERLARIEERGLLSDPMASRLARRDRFDPRARPGVTRVLRQFMEAFDAPATCARSACMRNGRCCGPKVDCFWLDLPLTRAAIGMIIAPVLARADEED